MSIKSFSMMRNGYKTGNYNYIYNRPKQTTLQGAKFIRERLKQRLKPQKVKINVAGTKPAIQTETADTITLHKNGFFKKLTENMPREASQDTRDVYDGYGTYSYYKETWKDKLISAFHKIFAIASLAAIGWMVYDAGNTRVPSNDGINFYTKADNTPKTEASDTIKADTLKQTQQSVQLTASAPTKATAQTQTKQTPKPAVKDTVKTTTAKVTAKAESTTQNNKTTKPAAVQATAKTTVQKSKAQTVTNNSTQTVSNQSSLPYKVKKNDNIWKITKSRYIASGVKKPSKALILKTVQKTIALNNLSNPSIIHIGDILQLPPLEV